MRLFILVFLAFTLQAFGQQKRPSFRMPEGIHAGDYSKAFVLVKTKANAPVNIQSRSVKVNGAQGLNDLSIRSLVPTKALQKIAYRTAPRESTTGINLNQFAEVAVQGNNVEDFINRLYATGLFELVEPIYIDNIRLTPNDEKLSSQYYLNLIKAQEAWDIATGENILIGIVDSGGDLDHPDIADKIYVDPAEPLDGIDNDGDGYIDNNRGWDFVGADTLNVNDQNFKGDNDPNSYTSGFGSHGTNVAGTAVATLNNGVGIAGVGYKAKVMFTKHTADNQSPNKGSLYLGYSGLLYAATHGAKIINLSWGSPFRSEIVQQLINFISLDLNCLIVSSAGNDGSENPFYPAAYNNVMSVASTTSSDAKSNFSNYGTTIDISAPGSSIQTTAYDNAYSSVSGTSFSSPIVAGAAALVWSKFPNYTAIQVAEQLRVTADESFYSKNSTTVSKKLGKGRLDILSALTKNLPSIRATNPRLVNASGSSAEPGEDAFLSMDFNNFLNSTSNNISITIKPVISNFVTLKKATINPGVIEGGKKYNNRYNPFEFKISSALGSNTSVTLLITYTDGNYSDYDYVTFLVNPTYIDIDENKVITTVASNGRIGYENTSSSTNGVGFVYEENSLLFEMGIIAGSSTTQLYNNVRATNSFDQDFTIVDKIREITPGERSASETFGSFNSSGAPAISVKYRSLAWRDVPYDKFVIMEYKVKNVSSNPLTGFNFALFSDWDITESGAQDIARWDPQTNLGYIYPAIENTKPHAGIRILEGISPIFYAIDNNQATPNAPFGLYDGFTDQEKITTITSGIGRTEAGTSKPEGGDVSTVVGAGPYNIGVNEEVTIVFALLAAPNLIELQQAGADAYTAYKLMLQAPKPIVQPVTTCYNSNANITATGAGRFKWYTDFTGGAPVFEGPTLTTGKLLRDTVLYVSNADKDYESVRTKATVTVSAIPEVLVLGTTTFCEGGSVTLTAGTAGSFLWSNGATTQSINVKTAGEYSVKLTDATLGCSTESKPVTISVSPLPVAKFSIENPALNINEEIKFINESTGGNNYFWVFGDNTTSTEKNPVKIYTIIKEYIIVLQVTNEFGCKANTNKTISVVTALEDEIFSTRMFPNPAREWITIEEESGVTGITLFDLGGKKTLSKSYNGEKQLTIDVRGEAPGLYLLKIHTPSGLKTRKVILQP